MNESANFKTASQKIQELFDATGFTGDRAASSHKFALTVTLATFKQMLEKMPADITDKVRHVLDVGGSDDIVKESLAFFSEAERNQMYTENLKQQLQHYIDQIKSSWTPEQTEKAQAVVSSVVTPVATEVPTPAEPQASEPESAIFP